jgi:hypothetical protein
VVKDRLVAKVAQIANCEERLTGVEEQLKGHEAVTGESGM